MLDILIPNIILPGIVSLFMVWVGVQIWLKKQYRLIKNLSQPIVFFDSRERKCEFEIDFLKETDFFNVSICSVEEERYWNDLTNYSIIIISYESIKGSAETHIEKIKREKKPVIIYTKPGEIDRGSDDMKAILEYELAEIANSPLRIINLIFSILSVKNYEN